MNVWHYEVFLAVMNVPRFCLEHELCQLTMSFLLLMRATATDCRTILSVVDGLRSIQCRGVRSAGSYMIQLDMCITRCNAIMAKDDESDLIPSRI